MMLPSAYLMHTITKRSMEQKARKRDAHAHAVLNMEYTASNEMLTPPAAAPMRSTSAASCRGRRHRNGFKFCLQSVVLLIANTCTGHLKLKTAQNLRQCSGNCKRARYAHETQGRTDSCQGGRQHEQRHRCTQHHQTHAHDLTRITLGPK